MSVEVTLGTPLADRLAGVIKPRLVEVGWSTGDDGDSTLSEYIILMLGAGKTQDQIAADLSGDLLNLGPDDPGALEFAKWLFDQVRVLSTQTADSQNPPSDQPPSEQIHSAVQHVEVEMEDANLQQKIPTGPKVMPTTRDKRMMNHMSKAMERKPNEKILHRVNGTGNSGRINTHKDVPRGPRSTLAQKLTKPLHNFPIVQPDPNSAITNLDPQQQLALLQIYEQQAKNMAVLLTQAGAMSSNVVPGLSGPSRSQQHGPSLFDRVENRRTGTRGGRERGSYNTRGRGGNSNGSWTQPSSHHTPSNGSADVEMTQDSPLDRPLTAAPTLPSDSACRFGLHCTNAECAYAHQSPAAPPGAPVDPTDSCSFGAACKNKKCTGRHPSPASIKSYQAQQSCKFWPHCANAACPFAHPESRPCRNGADCTVASCSFAHSSVRCKFNPCLNPACVYKHEEGQRRGNFGDKVWVNREGGDGSTSERKFMDEGSTEELIKPEAGGPETNNDTMGTEVMVS